MFKSRGKEGGSRVRQMQLADADAFPFPVYPLWEPYIIFYIVSSV